MVDKSRSGKAGAQMANTIIEMVHLMYQKQTARRFMRELVRVLKEKLPEFEED